MNEGVQPPTPNNGILFEAWLLLTHGKACAF